MRAGEAPRTTENKPFWPGKDLGQAGDVSAGGQESPPGRVHTDALRGGGSSPKFASLHSELSPSDPVLLALPPHNPLCPPSPSLCSILNVGCLDAILSP